MASAAAAKFLNKAKSLSAKVEPAGKAATKPKALNAPPQEVEDLVTPQSSKPTPPFCPKFFKFTFWDRKSWDITMPPYIYHSLYKLWIYMQYGIYLSNYILSELLSIRLFATCSRFQKFRYPGSMYINLHSALRPSTRVRGKSRDLEAADGGAASSW